jgi:hypothetical protein
MGAFFDPVENLKAVADMQAAGIEAASKLLSRFLQGGATPNGDPVAGFMPRFGAERPDGESPRSTRDLRVEAEQFIDQLAGAAKRMLEVWTDLGARGPTNGGADRVDLTVVDRVATTTVVVPGGLDDLRFSDVVSSAGLSISPESFRWMRVDLGDAADRISVRLDLESEIEPGVYHGVITAPSAPDFARLVTVTIPRPSSTAPQP